MHPKLSPAEIKASQLEAEHKLTIDSFAQRIEMRAAMLLSKLEEIRNTSWLTTQQKATLILEIYNQLNPIVNHSTNTLADAHP